MVAFGTTLYCLEKNNYEILLTIAVTGRLVFLPAITYHSL